MVLIWISFLVEIFFLALIKALSFDSNFIVIFAVLFHAGFVFIVLMRYKFKHIFMGAFLIRMFFAFWDVYARHIFILPDSNSDADGFFATAIKISEDMSLMGESVYGSVWSKLIGGLFYLIGQHRIFAHYFNVLLGLSTIIVLYQILVLLNISNKTNKFMLTIYAIFPYAILSAAVLRREAIIVFFVTYSFYFFVKWFKMGNDINMLLAIALLVAGSVFHAGTIGIFAGYAFAFVFYNRKKKIYNINKNTIFALSVIALIAFIIFIRFQNILLEKFSGVDELSDLYSTANYREGGAQYLAGLTIESPIQMIVYLPIKILFFLISPFPTDWRGLSDIFAFCVDSSFYLGTILYFIKNRKYFTKEKNLILCIVIALLCVTCIFGIGVFNSGQALRHRNKIVPIFMVLMALMIEEKKNYNQTYFTILRLVSPKKKGTLLHVTKNKHF